METDKIKQLIRTLQDEVADLIDVHETIVSPHHLRFIGSLMIPHERAIAAMEERFARHGYIPLIRRLDGGVEVRVVSTPRVVKKPRIRVNILLLFATVFTTLVAGTALAQSCGFFRGLFLIISRPGTLLKGIPFSFTILSILGIHELGHYLTSRFHGVKATLPYFIPAPTILGTLGAVIKTRSMIPDRKSLLDIGASGPIAGFIVSVAAFIIGLRLSEFGYFPGGLGLYLGDSIIVRALVNVFKGPAPEGAELFLHPVAFAGWIGFFVTMLNLLPAGQLDGGHICYALFGRKHFFIARATIAMLILLSFIGGEAGMIWLFWAMLIWIMGLGHAPPVNDITPLDGRRKVLGAIATVIFILCFVPGPFKFA